MRLLGRRLAVASALALGGAAAALEGYPAEAVSNAEATVVAPIGIANAAALNFGKFFAGNGGSVVMSAAGARSSPGGGVLLTGTAGNAAAFSVAGDHNATYAITLPAGDAIVIHATDSTKTMSVGTWLSDPSGTGTIPGTGSQSVKVGATLIVGAGQTPGSYTGSFSVSVEYN